MSPSEVQSRQQQIDDVESIRRQLRESSIADERVYGDEPALWLPKPLHWVLLIVLAILVHITVEIVTSKPVSEDVPPPIYLPY